MIGQVVGSYRVVRPLGEGGMGAVYLAEHALLGRKAAIKVLLPALSSRQDIVSRFFNEARAATAIADPGIVQIFDVGYHADGSAFIAMELLEGEPLDQRLRRRDRLPPIDALRVARQVAITLAAAHAKGIVHRDLKPENVYLVPDPEVTGGERAKILDFGIAKLAGGTAPGLARPQTGVIVGTPLYLAPEQGRGAGDIDHRADIYALGCVLYHLLVGRPPFTSDAAGDLVAMHLHEAPVPPSAYLPDLGPAIDALVLRCLAKAPADRFASMIDLAAALELAADSAGSAVAPAIHAGYVLGPAVTPLPALNGPSWHPPARSPTTLGGGAGAVIRAAPARSPRGRWFGALAVIVAAIATVWIASQGRRMDTTDPAATPSDRGAAANGSTRSVEGASAGTLVVDAVKVDVPAGDAGGSVDAGVAVRVDEAKPPRCDRRLTGC